MNLLVSLDLLEIELLKRIITLLSALLVIPAIVTAEDVFHVYAPSPEAKQLWVIPAKPSLNDSGLSVESKVDLDFSGRTISIHPSQPFLYVGSSGGAIDQVAAATVSLDSSGAVAGHQPFKLKHGTTYFSTDRSGRFVLSASYGNGIIGVYGLDEKGFPAH